MADVNTDQDTTVSIRRNGDDTEAWTGSMNDLADAAASGALPGFERGKLAGDWTPKQSHGVTIDGHTLAFSGGVSLNPTDDVEHAALIDALRGFGRTVLVTITLPDRPDLAGVVVSAYVAGIAVDEKPARSHVEHVETVKLKAASALRRDTDRRRP